jgi:excisionase family DNA binding protein
LHSLDPLRTFAAPKFASSTGSTSSSEFKLAQATRALLKSNEPPLLPSGQLGVVQDGGGPIVSGEAEEKRIVSPTRLLTVSAVADRTETPESTVRREIRLRHLPIYRIGRAIRISEADLDTFLRKRRRNAR